MPQFFYQSKSEPVVAAPEAVTVDRWLPAWPQPRRALASAALLASGVVGPLVTPAPALSTFDWFHQTSQPSRAAAPNPGASQSVLATVPPPAADVFPSQPQPSRAVVYAAGSSVAPVSTAPESTTVDRWLPTFRQPDRTPRYAPGTAAVGSPLPIPNPDAPSFDWFQSHPQPPPVRPRLAGFTVVPVSTSPESVTVDRWLPTWTQPRPLPPRPPGTAAVPPTVPTPFDWYGTQPGPSAVAPRPAGSLAAPVFTPPASLAVFDWFIAPGRPPSSAPPRPLGSLAAPVLSIPNPPAPSFDWFVLHPQPDRARKGPPATGIGFLPVDFVPNAGGTLSFVAALRARLLAESSLAELTDVYRRRSRPNAAFPFMVLNVIGSDPDPTTGLVDWPDWTEVQFAVIDDDDERAERLRDAAWRSLFPGTAGGNIAFTGGKDGGGRLPGRRWEVLQPGPPGKTNGPAWAFYCSCRFYRTVNLT